MNSIVDLLHELRAKSINVSASGNELLLEAPPGILTPELRERMRENKPAILRLLSNAPAFESPITEIGNAAHTQLDMSRAQRAIWLLEQINPGTCVWNVSWALDVHGELDRNALEGGCRALLERHATLRSRFRNADGAPVVEHAPVGDWHVDYNDLRGSQDAEAEAAAQAKAAVQRPFDLEHGPLFRVSLLQTGEAAYVLVVVVHHMVADGWSLGLMGIELSKLYENLAHGQPPRLPVPRVDYQAFIRRASEEEAVTNSDLDWWRDTLSGELPIISLAHNIARQPSGAGRRISIELSAELSNRIEVFARQRQATPFMVLLAAFKLLLQRYSGQTDVLVGVHVSGRDRTEFADVVGMFVNTLVLRTSVTPDLTADELVARVRDTSLEAFARQHVAFDRVVDALKVRRIAGHNPLVRHTFAYQNLRPGELRLGDAELRQKPLELGGARYELAVEVWRTQNGLWCDFEYATDLFEADMVERMLENYRRLLTEIVAQPDEVVSRLPLLSDIERAQLLKNGNGDTTDYPAKRRLEQLFAEQAMLCPDAIALICRGQSMTYRELDTRANQLAQLLRTFDVGPNVLVGVCLERTPDLVIALLAVLKAGGAYVPLDPTYPKQRLAFMLEDSAAPILITSSTLRGVFANAGRVIELDKVQHALADRPATAPVTGATSEDLAYVIYTSGSTGRPKGTQLRHSAVYLVDWARRSFAPEELARVVAGTSICFDLSVFELFVPLATGGTILLVNDPLDLPDAATRPTLLNTVPSALAELARSRMIPGSVRTIIACGERLNASTVDALHEAAGQARVYNVYGPTEYTTYATAALTMHGTGQPPPIGRPLFNTQVYVLDAQRQLLPIGAVGELYITGDGLARGYLNRPQLTGECFVANPFGPPGSRMYRTGDLVRWSSAGLLEFIGRADQQIKLRGFRIELGEIEATLRRHPAVRDAVVTASTDAANPQPIAYIVGDGNPPTPAELRQHLREWLPEHMVPSAFVTLPALPLTPSGKIDRQVLPPPTPHQASTCPDHAWIVPMQHVIADTFRDVLRLDHFGIGDNFFDKGGHSLAAITASSHLERMLAQPVSPAWIFQAPTPLELTLLLETSFATPTTHIVPLQPLGDRPPLFCIHDLNNRAFNYANCARLLAPDQPLYGLVPGPLEASFADKPLFDSLRLAYVAAIKAVQPHGPYRIVGFSFGGVLAFEVAHALLAEGKDVLLIMIDPYIAGPLPNLPQTAEWIYRRGASAVKGIWAAEQSAVRKLATTGKWAQRQSQRAVKKLGESLNQIRPPWKSAAAPVAPDWISPAGRPFAVGLLQAVSTFRYEPFGGSVLFIQGTDRGIIEDYLNADGLNGWNGLFTGPLTRIELPGRHEWMMREPIVSQVAEILRSL